ncbi:MAG TPA: flagellar assembly protein FliW [Solirubrobacteraceae bacterium]|nr:flagellar assembly protein FliW [Solirubrobacteraceae bacterium]
MPVTFESVRFGTVEVEDSDVIEFPRGLIGLGGNRWALLDRNPGTEFRWLHNLEDGALALPVVPPAPFFSDFALEVAAEDLAGAGIDDLGEWEVYVTVRAAPDPLDITANLRAPLVIRAGRGYQLLNTVEGASLQAPLFELAASTEHAPARSADAA